MEEKNYRPARLKEWKCPDATGVPLITMPNIPKPLHGQGMQPRTIFGKTEWEKTRKMTYFKADYKCEVCGCSPEKGQLHAHELFSYDYKEGTGKFERCIAICKYDHDFIHSGRLLTMYKNGNPLYPKSYVLKVVEKGFKLIHDYNQMHKNKRPLRAYASFLEYLKEPSLAKEIQQLIDKYDMLFYDMPNHIAPWEEWRAIVNGREYHTPYKSFFDWQDAMSEQAQKDNMRNIEDPFKGSIYDDIAKLLEN